MARVSAGEPGFGSTPKTIVIGTAGHIDHGKTALIRALTGVDTDRLPEEKKRGITIDLGFASMELAAPDGSPLRVSFIDVPGHARFVSNMLAGAGGIDAVLLVVSAQEGVKPQTEEHLAICSLLGVQCGITVLTKIDAVDAARLAAVRSSVEKFLSTTFLASEPIVGASASTTAGLDRVRHELSLQAARIPERNSEFVARLPIDRSFAMKGFGTVVTGTLMAGSVEAGQELAVEPGGRTAKVRGIQVHGMEAREAEAATRVALNLSRVEAGELQRGDTLVQASTIAAVDVIDAEVSLLTGSPALKHRARVHFHAFATECMATVSLYGYQPIEPSSKRMARLRLARPIVLLPGDRFVLRHGAPITTVGGGVVLDAHAVQRLNKARTLDWLHQLANATTDKQLALRVARRGTAGTTISELSAETGLRVEAIQGRLAVLLQSGKICSLANGLLLSRAALVAASDMVQQNLGRSFQSGAGAVKRSALKSQVRLQPEVVDWVAQHLEQNKMFRISGEEILPPGTDKTASSVDEANLATIDQAYRQAGLASPSPGNLAVELAIDLAQMRRLMTILLREKRLVRLGDDVLCVHQDALANLKERVRALRGQTIDVAGFKEFAGVSRKYAIPLLEYLDRERVTRRQGDQRVVI
jgi:selenocysteine-specific elongation factor